MTIPYRFVNGFGRSLFQNSHGVEVAQEDLLRSHFFPSLGHRRKPIQVNHGTSQPSHPLEDLPRVAADVQPRLNPLRMQRAHQLLFVRPNKLVVKLRAHQGSRGVADAYEIRSHLDLKSREAQFQLRQ